jgi:hypothetical protein
VRVVDADGCDLTGSPASIGTAPDASQPAVQSVGAGARYTRAFGGFWPDLSNAEAVIAGKQALGWISEEEAEQLRAWRRDGFVILPQAVSADDIDRLLMTTSNESGRNVEASLLRGVLVRTVIAPPLQRSRVLQLSGSRLATRTRDELQLLDRKKSYY